MSKGDATLPPPNRLETLADGVFAIAMTLLVLELSVPSIAEVDETGSLTAALREMWPEFLMYALSFLVLGVFWLIHHLIFDAIDGYDTTLVWLNIGFLLFAGIIPFSTALAGRHGVESMTAFIYGLNMLLIFSSAWALWTYATSASGLTRPDLDPDTVAGGRAMGWIYTLFMIPLLVLAFIVPLVSFLGYGLLVALFIVFTVLGRGEVVVLWPVSTGQGEEADEIGDG